MEKFFSRKPKLTTNISSLGKSTLINIENKIKYCHMDQNFNNAITIQGAHNGK